MTLFEHLTELRSRIIKSLLAVTVAGAVVFAFYVSLQHRLAGPYRDVCAAHPKLNCTGQFIAIDPLDPFAVRLKVAGYGGLILAFPVVMWQIWRFITPGLKPTEKRYAIPFILTSVLLFSLGAALAFLTYEKALEFLLLFGGDVQAAFSVGKYMSLLMLLMLVFGLGFEFPVVLVALQMIGVVTHRKLLSWWRYAVVLIVVVDAVATPSGDPFSLLAMAVPMILFYFGAIGVGALIAKRRARDAEVRLA